MLKSLFKVRPIGTKPVVKSQNEMVEEIHETFYTEVDRLLAEAKILKSTDTEYQDLLDKSEHLKKLGFTNTQECKNAEAELQRLLIIKNENNDKQELSRAIAYFNVAYPNNKFITEASVEKICNKYGLVYGPNDRYIGTVPDKNLKEMAAFQLKIEDTCYSKRVWNSYTRGVSTAIGYLGYPEFNILYTKKYYTKADSKSLYFDFDGFVSTEIKPCRLEIAAPIKDFNMEGMDQVRSKLFVKPLEYDPVVLQPVHFGGKKYYLILTAWGEEASDELVVNQKMN